MQKDYFEELQTLLDESHAAVIDVTRQLKMCEHNWNCEPKELLTYLSEVHVDWGKQSENAKVKMTLVWVDFISCLAL